MSRSRGVSITLRDLRIAKLDGHMKPKPCTSELEALMSAMAKYGEDKVPAIFGKALSDCMDQTVSLK